VVEEGRQARLDTKPPGAQKARWTGQTVIPRSPRRPGDRTPDRI